MKEVQNTGAQDEITEKDLHLKIYKSFHSRSDSAQEIISRRPGFIEKWALIFFLGILLLIVGGTWFIRYPDVIEARGTLTADNTPKEIIAMQRGRLIRLFVKNGEVLKKGDMVGWLESTANTNEVLNLSHKIKGCCLIFSEESSSCFEKDLCFQ